MKQDIFGVMEFHSEVLIMMIIIISFKELEEFLSLIEKQEEHLVLVSF